MSLQSSGQILKSRKHLISCTIIVLYLFLYIEYPVHCEPEINLFTEIADTSAINNESIEEVNLTSDDSTYPIIPDINESSTSEELKDTASATTVDVFVYVFNRDDDKLSVSLFIDSEFKDTQEISKEKELKFDCYPIAVGPHSFKISWWDDDTKKSYIEEKIEDISFETSVMLYTSINQEPVKYEITVELRNEYEISLDAYLYIDGEYEKRKEISKKSTSDFGDFDLEEGTHELKVRWQDPDTRIEYEKRKTIRVDGNDVVVFYAPQGITFERNEDKSTKSSAKTDGTSSTTPSTEKISDSSNNTINKTQKGSTEISESKSGPKETIETKDVKHENQNSVYIYLILIIVGIYILFFRKLT